ncbi:nuclear-pore anchor-like isoform X4 [Magnolia sinica]|uniref:nuclear-pore anchor-like isoform X4 n=1 Tax=Magnolia sinica TaxID=86752 RepID=UPI00265A753D|nr:nuclear-pore anchor-like isoform X4 [Magnolia sinica]
MLFSPSTQGRDDRFPEKDCIVEYASIIQKKGDIPSTHTLSLLAKLADKLKKSVEDEIYFLKPRVSELESDLVSKSTEVTSAVSRKEEALSSTFAEIDRLKEENSVKM